MTEDIYRKLAQRLDAIPNGFSATESGSELRLLAKIFTPEEATLAGVMRLRRELAADIAAGSGGICAVWAAAGNYFVYRDGPDDTVSLRERVRLYGGFAGDEGSLGQRDWQVYETILDGRAGEAADAERVFHVVTGADDSMLDGVVVQQGLADGELEEDQRGAGALFEAVIQTDIEILSHRIDKQIAFEPLVPHLFRCVYRRSFRLNTQPL